MNSEDKHVFVEFSVEYSMIDTFKKKWICTRCNCEKLLSIHNNYYYSRENIFYTERPKCFGSVPINDQTIDL